MADAQWEAGHASERPGAPGIRPASRRGSGPQCQSGLAGLPCLRWTARCRGPGWTKAPGPGQVRAAPALAAAVVVVQPDAPT